MSLVKEKKLKILYCSMALTFGGEQKQLSKILTYIDKNTIQPVVCCIRDHGYIEQKILDLANPFICLHIKSKYNIIGEVLGLYKVIKKQNINLIHTGIFGSEFSPLLASLISGVPAVVFLTTTYDLEARFAVQESTSRYQYLKAKMLFMVHGFLSRIVKVRYIAYSQVIKDSAVKNLHLPPDRVSLIPLGLDTKDFKKSGTDSKTSIQKEIGLDKSYPMLLNVARLSPVKGQNELIEIMPEILKTFPDAALLIAGDGPLMEELNALIEKLQLRDHVFLLGQRDDVANLLNACDIFVFSSYYEGLPGSVVEAMAAERPVIAYDILPLAEIMQNRLTGITVAGRNQQLFAESVIELARSPETGKEMAKKAKQKILEKFDIARNIDALQKVYQKVSNNVPISTDPIE